MFGKIIDTLALGCVTIIALPISMFVILSTLANFAVADFKRIWK